MLKHVLTGVSGYHRNLEHAVLELTSLKLSCPKWKLTTPLMVVSHNLQLPGQGKMTGHSWVDKKQIQLMESGNKSQCSFLIGESFTALGLRLEPFGEDLNEYCGTVALLPSQEHTK